MVKDFKSQSTPPKKDFKQGGYIKKDFASRGGNGGGFQKGGRPGFRGGRQQYDQGPPEKVDPMCEYSHSCGDQIIVKATNTSKVPKFNRGIYLQNKTKIGTVDEIFGPIEKFFYSVKLEKGITPDSYKVGDQFYMGYDDLLPVDRFLGKPRAQGGRSGGQRGGGSSFGRGGGQRGGGFQRGGRGGKGNSFGGGRGGSFGGNNRGGGGYKKSFK
ncbi:hypothetical protein IMG5_118530 [Ichthyophthirius multifiliis]|uniref:H/ACA ribonucleoprotein complex subunit n=1 Tax=Ichthyophthirius multifiliis TaxID=5932 RepID=G0QUQ2_ICHMU|nr:hypothetical protein IMG5_118530 [Ichthyophthirius multifiliis]EGR31055.1 hypothetical protein IMG5_118530 [Ichthyophthirius multifiliis]|eukprot:XP_004034541.1 hypothetical protein IMG5_118530 [Ichthyophthirius multifiliis]